MTTVTDRGLMRSSMLAHHRRQNAVRIHGQPRETDVGVGVLDATKGFGACPCGWRLPNRTLPGQGVQPPPAVPECLEVGRPGYAVQLKAGDLGNPQPCLCRPYDEFCFDLEAVGL